MLVRMQEESENEKADLQGGRAPQTPREREQAEQVAMLVKKGKAFKDLPYYAFTRMINDPAVRKEVLM